MARSTQAPQWIWKTTMRMYLITVWPWARIVQCLLSRDIMRGCLSTRNNFNKRTSFIIFKILIDFGTGRSS